jgi:DNA-binding response OmpR family regulator
MKDDSTRLLVVDDDTELCAMLEEYLTSEAMEVVSIHDGRGVEDRLATEPYDLIILDVMLPGMSGFEVLRALRTKHDTPVLMLTARGDDVDRIVGLEIGADDYLPKPFNPRELVARIRAILRRTGPRGEADGPVKEKLEVGSLVLDLARHKAFLGDRDLELTGAEFRILESLMRHAGRVVSREDLTREALGREITPYDRSLDTHISNLRKKLGPDRTGESPVGNVRGAGYTLSNAGTDDETSSGNP